MVQSWAPFHAGTLKNSLYAFLCLLPPPVGGESEFTEMYLKKLSDWRKLDYKRYQVPLEGSKIFVRVLQQVNGWQNEVSLFQASALAPADPGLRARELAALLQRWQAARPQK